MIVYGDRHWTESTASLLQRTAHYAGLACTGSRWERHAMLASAWLEAGLLLQGVADAEFAVRGADDLSDMQVRVTALAMLLARRLMHTWDTGSGPNDDAVSEQIESLAEALPRAVLTLRLPEGHAFYALYPEAYALAARALPAAPTRVIGLRSIGGGLATMVAAALNAPAPITVRPAGHPFDRKLMLAEPLQRYVRTYGAERWCLVDEGPGFSGSSFAAAAQTLAENGVAPARVHVFPGHSGEPGPMATEARRTWWRRMPRHVATFEQVALPRLCAWVGDLTGPCTAIEDVGAGAWRRHVFAREADWPAVWAQQERRKYLLETATGRWLAKFAGLGRIGEDKLARARRLASAGFTPPIAGLRHGFLAMPWIDGRPLEASGVPRERIIETLGRYLGYRRRHFAACAEDGATFEQLCDMAACNLAEGAGEGASAAIARLRPELARLARLCRPVAIDGRLHAWEWLVATDGRLLKTDSLDHSAAHDLIGCQDVTWDIAGAWAEFDLDAGEESRLCAIVADTGGAPVASPLLPLMKLCYLAFQLGRSTIAAGMSAGDETLRLQRDVRRYALRVHSIAKDSVDCHIFGGEYTSAFAKATADSRANVSPAVALCVGGSPENALGARRR